jgi:hypothetical protein
MEKVCVFLLVFIISAFSLLTAQQIFPLPVIHKVVVSDGILLQIENNEKYQILVKFQDMDSSCLKKSVKNGILTLEIGSGTGCTGKVSVNFGCPGLKEIEATGKAEVSTKNLMKNDSLKVTLKSGAQAYIDMDIKYLKAGIGGGALLKAEGYAVSQDISVTAGGTFSGFDLESDIVKVKTSLGGKAKICVAEELNATTASSGYISYKCSPKKKTIDSEAGGTVEESKE